MNLPTIIALVAIAAFFLFIIGVTVLRRSLGSLTITAETGPFSPGDVIDAQLRLNASRELSWDAVTIALRCLDTADRGGSLPHHEIYRDERTLSGPGSLAAGGSQSFAVSLAVPMAIDSGGLSLDLPEAVEGLLEPLMETASRRRAMDIRWELVAEATIDPIDMSDSLRVDVDLLP